MFSGKKIAFFFLFLASTLRAEEYAVPKAIPVDSNGFVVMGPPTRAEVAKMVLQNPHDVRALEWAIKQGIVTKKQALDVKVTGNVFPSQVSVFESQLLPFHKARVDVFMFGSKIHDIKQEFSVLTIDDEIREIGLVSSGKEGHRTPAQAWEIYGVDKNRQSSTYHSSPMPYAFLLSHAGSKYYCETAFHGTAGYGYGGFGGPASSGCIRQFTQSSYGKDDLDPGAKWPAPGHHRVVWKWLNPFDVHHADHLDNVLFGSWYDESDHQRALMRELRYKTTVFTHSPDSLAKIPGWKEALEAVYPKDLIQSAISQNRKSGGKGYREFSSNEDGDVVFVDHANLRRLYEIEAIRYTTPRYLRTEEPEAVQYARRHTDWIDLIRR